MKKSDVGLLLYVVGLITALILTTGCVAKHPKCAAYDKVDYAPMFKTNFERSIYK
jgi:hypothetical protein